MANNNILVEKLQNGLTVVYAPNATSTSTTISLVVGVGSYNVTPNFSGLPHFLEHMISTRSSKNRSDIDFIKEIDDLNIFHNAVTTPTSTCYMVSGKPQLFAPMFDILMDQYLNPKFDAKEISLEREVLIEENRKRKDDPIDKLDSLMTSFMTEPSTLTTEIESSVEAITKNDLVDYYNMFYDLKNVAIVFYGKFHLPSVKKQTMNFLSEIKFQRKISPKFASIPKFKIVWQNQLKPNVSIKYNKYMHQTYTYLAFPYENIDNIAQTDIQVLMQILCLSASSRLYIALRANNGISYNIDGINTELVSTTYIFVISIVMNPESYLEGIEIILDEITKLKKKLIDEHDLAKAKNDAELDFEDLVDDDKTMANTLGENVLNGKNYVFNNKAIIRRLRGLQPLDIKRAAIKLFDKSKLNLFTYGNLTYDKESYVELIKNFS
jgi:predicted Zn-dependent peptidase